MAKEEKVSPEEKLLKVIQGDKKAAPTAQPPAKGSAVEIEGPTLATVSVAATGVEEGLSAEEAELVAAAAAPKLKLAKTDAKAEAAAPQAASPVPAGGAAAPAAAPAAKRPLPSFSARVGGRGVAPVFSWRELNRVLALAIVLFLVFAVWDIWGMVSRAGAATGLKVHPGSRGGQAPVVEPAAPVADGGLAPLPKYLATFEKRPIVENLDQVQGERSGGQVIVTPPVEQAVLKLKGLSATGETGDEAILEDAKTRKLYFVKAGDKFSAGDFEFEVLQIEADKVTLAKGSEQIVLK